MTITGNPVLLDIRIDEKRYGQRRVLQHLHLCLREGEIVSLIGASGCGKSTLLSIVSGLDDDYKGSVQLDGVTLRGASADIGFIFQEPRLFPWLTVAQNVEFARNAVQLHGDAATCLAEVGLAGFEDALPRQLSGGQAQRAAIARGLFTRPRILLLDEPFSAVDAFTRITLQKLLQRVTRQHGLTILLVTHDIGEALKLSDRIMLMDQSSGAIAREYSPQWGIRDIDGWQQGDPEALAGWEARIFQDLHEAHIL